MTTTSSPVNLSQLRQNLRLCRKSLSAQQYADHAQALKRHFLAYLSLSRSLAIGVTFAFDGEIDPLPLIHALQSLGHSTYLPLLRDDKHLDFALWHEASLMVRNRFGIDEPQDTQVADVNELDILLVPLVGVDKQGNRLGMGGGYYDRTLGKVQQRPYLVGMAHSCQLVAQLPVQPWDIPLDALVTEQELIIWHAWQDKGVKT
jgi:5-formyltetrahydrofolate cyclo-ligase